MSHRFGAHTVRRIKARECVACRRRRLGITPSGKRRDHDPCVCSAVEILRGPENWIGKDDSAK